MWWEYLLAILGGVLINLLLTLNDVFGRPEFRWKLFFNENIISTLLNLICGIILVWRKDEMVNVFPISILSAAFISSSGQFLWKKVTKIFSEKYTFVGGGTDMK